MVNSSRDHEISVHNRLRPARIALLVRPTDLISIRHFMRVSTCMWGGTQNPIIPVYRNPPRHWRATPLDRTRGYNVAKGYITFFEPDAYVEAEAGWVEKAGLEAISKTPWLHRRALPLDELLVQREQGAAAELNFGLPVTDSLREIYNNERQFVLREDVTALVVPPENHSAVVEAIFGVFPTEVSSAYFARAFDDVYRPQPCPASPKTWRRAYIEGAVTPLRATSYRIETHWAWHSDLVVFVFDPTKPTDLIDLWNLRIESKPVLPVPLNWFGDLVGDIARTIIEEYRPARGDPAGPMHRATVEFARSISREDAKEMTQQISAEVPSNHAGTPSAHNSPFVTKDFRTRIWENIPNWLPHAERRESTAAELRSRITVRSGSNQLVPIDGLDPPFASRFRHSELRWVNVLRVSDYLRSQIATLYPFNTFDPRYPRLSLGAEPVVIGSEGWSFGMRHKGLPISVSLSNQSDAVIEWLKSFDIAASLSEPGQISRQILENIGGLWHTRILTDEETLRALNAMAGSFRRITVDGQPTEQRFGERSRPVKDWTDLVKRRNDSPGRVNTSLERFTTANVIRLGIETGCPHCLATNWHDIEESAYSLKCVRCLKPYPFPQAALKPHNGNWAYRVIGPFAVPDYARGSYSAVLALSVLSRTVTVHESITYSTALSLEFDGVNREVDFVVWHAAESFAGNQMPQIVLGEAKSFGKGQLVQSSDLAKLKELGAKIPEAILAVAVLRPEFSDVEKDLLRRFAHWCSRSRFRNSLLLLTGVELLHEGPITASWRDAGGAHAKLAERHYSDLRSIADASVAIHLKPTETSNT